VDQGCQTGGRDESLRSQVIYKWFFHAVRHGFSFKVGDSGFEPETPVLIGARFLWSSRLLPDGQCLRFRASQGEASAQTFWDTPILVNRRTNCQAPHLE
jgi:hypothetical protein